MKRDFMSSFTFGMLAFCMMNFGCDIVHPTVRFVIPDTFHGPFVIYEDASGESPKVHGRVTEFEIPENRTLRITSTHALYVRSSHEAVRKNGSKLLLDHEAKDSEVALRSIGAIGQNDDPTRYHFYFVGTQSEREKFDPNPDNFRPPPSGDPKTTPAKRVVPDTANKP